jgi:hypothetical protein
MSGCRPVGGRKLTGSYLAIAAALPPDIPPDIALAVTRTFAGYSMGMIALIK